MVFEKVPFEKYLSFYRTISSHSELYSVDENWLKIQYDYLKPPVKKLKNTYSFFCPENISLKKGGRFYIHTGFKCCSDFSYVICDLKFKAERFKTKPKIYLINLKDAIILGGRSREMKCFCQDDVLFDLTFDP